MTSRRIPAPPSTDMPEAHMLQADGTVSLQFNGDVHINRLDAVGLVNIDFYKARVSTLRAVALYYDPSVSLPRATTAARRVIALPTVLPEGQAYSVGCDALIRDGMPVQPAVEMLMSLVPIYLGIPVVTAEQSQTTQGE